VGIRPALIFGAAFRIVFGIGETFETFLGRAKPAAWRARLEPPTRGFGATGKVFETFKTFE
jgi:hypothetical protein